MPPEHVLVPLDGSPLADDALVEALATYDCPVTVLNVVTPLDAGMSEGGVLEPGAERQADARERAEDLIERAERRAAEEGREIDALVKTGDPADTILDVVAELDVDHVVMGGHGGERNELARRLLGTVATSVVSEAPVSVTVVR
jgi:nucleotide-binding universal stress UspA family protein